MAAVGIEFLVVHHSAVGDNNVSAECPSGNYETYFDVAAACFRQAPASSAVGAGGSLGALLAGARAAGLRVHLGLAEQEKLGVTIDGVRHNPLYGRYRNATAVQHFQHAQAALARALWAAFGGTGLIDGFYTFLEEPQNFASALPDWGSLAVNYFQPLAHYIKHSLAPIAGYAPGKLKVWSSPDAVGNWTRYPRAAMLGPRLYGDLWEQVFLMAPDFDLVALQDSQGERGQNSLSSTADFLGNCSAAAARQGRGAWSNVELFQVWPPSCEWSKASGHCRGRAPAPMDRIIAQMETASAVLARTSGAQEVRAAGLGAGAGAGDVVLIAWEWSSCLSPNGGTGKANISSLAANNYLAYQKYIQG